ncbi:hypothetical protein ACUNWD_18440 [Sunxiuqinia sp. A32]|uniref:hypothetical protein n=1 Tax=Sunxiuqinia sp. A32 TaxID=3461496 RepID=UPI004046144C
MKTKSKKAFIFKAVVFGILAVALISFIVMLLWNWLMPALFGLTIITFWQSLGLLALAKILFSSKSHAHHFQRYHREKFWEGHFKDRWAYAKAHSHQSDEEKTE